MRATPHHWGRTSLGEVAEVLAPRRQKDAAPVLTFKGLRRDGSLDLLPEEAGTFTVASPGDIVFTKQGHVGGWVMKKVGRVLATQERIHVASTLQAIRPSDQIDSSFLYLWLASPDNYAAVQTLVGERNSITKPVLASVSVPLPPIAEQRLIVRALDEYLSRLDAGTREMQSTLMRLKTLEQALLDSAFRTRIAGNPMTVADVEGLERERFQSWRELNPSKPLPSAAKPIDADLIPHGSDWPVVSLESATDPVRLIRYGILMPKVASGGVVPYVEVKDLIGDSLADKALHRTSVELDEKFAGARLQEGDVVIAVRGSYERTAIVPHGFEGTNISRDVARISPLASVSPRFLHYWLRSPAIKGFLSRHARGVAVKGVNIASLRGLPVPMPSPSAQEQIAAQLDEEMGVVSRLRHEVDRALIQSAALRRSLICRAFSGHLVTISSELESV
jgi:type I restriction enzyme S subunit